MSYWSDKCAMDAATSRGQRIAAAAASVDDPTIPRADRLSFAEHEIDAQDAADAAPPTPVLGTYTGQRPCPYDQGLETCEESVSDVAESPASARAAARTLNATRVTWMPTRGGGERVTRRADGRLVR